MDEGWRWIEGVLFRVVVNVVVRGGVYLGGQIISMENRNPAMLPMQQSREVGDGGGRPWWYQYRAGGGRFWVDYVFLN